MKQRESQQFDKLRNNVMKCDETRYAIGSMCLSFIMTYTIYQSMNQTSMRPRTSSYLSAGGILADAMGLGKTLTVLSMIVHSKEEATK